MKSRRKRKKKLNEKKEQNIWSASKKWEFSKNEKYNIENLKKVSSKKIYKSCESLDEEDYNNCVNRAKSKRYSNKI